MKKYKVLAWAGVTIAYAAMAFLLCDLRMRWHLPPWVYWVIPIIIGSSAILSTCAAALTQNRNDQEIP